jgi:hypothetical protein
VTSTYLLCLDSSPPPTTVSIGSCKQSANTYQRPLESISIRLESSQRIRLIRCPINDLAWGSTEVFQDRLELVAGWRRLRHVELEFGSLRLVLRVVRGGLISSRMGNCLRVGLFENRVDADRCLAAGLVEEGYNVLRAVLLGQRH